MCLAVPGQLVEISQEHGLRFGRVDFGGVCKLVCLEHTSDAQIGDYVLVHVGFALARVDAAQARQMLKFIAGLGALDED
jgi:hydrogenase expression/formation protein HypC